MGLLSDPVPGEYWGHVQRAADDWVAQILRAKCRNNAYVLSKPYRWIEVNIPELRMPRAEAWRRLNEETSMARLKTLIENPAGWFTPKVTMTRIELKEALYPSVMVPESRSRGRVHPDRMS